MTRKQKTCLTVVTGILLAYFALTVVASEGTVTDQVTGKPIVGAFVIVYWNANTGWVVQPHTSCYFMEATTTDEKGRFYVSQFTGNLNPLRKDRIRNEHIYVPGYQLTTKSNAERLNFIMMPREGSKSEQFKAIRSLGSQGAGCSVGNQKSRLPYLRALHKELATLATTKDESDQVESILLSADIVEFGEDVARQKYRERREEKWKVIK